MADSHEQRSEMVEIIYIYIIIQKIKIGNLGTGSTHSRILSTIYDH